MIEFDIITKIYDVVKKSNGFNVSYDISNLIGSDCNVECYITDSSVDIKEFEFNDYTEDLQTINFIVSGGFKLKQGAKFELDGLRQQYDYCNKLRNILQTIVWNKTYTYSLDSISNKVFSNLSLMVSSVQYSSVNKNVTYFSINCKIKCNTERILI